METRHCDECSLREIETLRKENELLKEERTLLWDVAAEEPIELVEKLKRENEELRKELKTEHSLSFRAHELTELKKEIEKLTIEGKRWMLSTVKGEKEGDAFLKQITALNKENAALKKENEELRKSITYWRDESQGMQGNDATLRAKEDVEKCGYDRNGSLSADEYVCTCGCHCGNCDADTTPPTTQAAVEAFKRKAIEVCEGEIDTRAMRYTQGCEDCIKAIESLPADDGALREVCMEVAAHYDADEEYRMKIVDEVLNERRA